MSKYKAFVSRHRGQAMLEFALILPLLLLVVFGLLEVGRALFMYTATINASREAARYASAYGVDADYDLHYQDCADIRAVAKRTGFLLRLEDSDITINYDPGPDRVLVSDPDGVPDSGDEVYNEVPPTSADIFDTCDDTTDGVDDGVDTDVVLSCGDRIVVTVTATYAPSINILPIGAHDIVSTSARTYYGVISLEGDTALSCDNDPSNDP